MMNEHGKDWEGKPVRNHIILPHSLEELTCSKNDLLSWFIYEAPDGKRDDHDLILRVLTINFASIHATSMV